MVGRAQTGIDFLIGMGVFLLTVGFIVGFVPGMFAPFTGDQQQQLVADRTADALVHGLLAGDGPSVLDTACTVAFFGVDNDATCPFDESDPVRDRVGFPAQYELNVTLERNVTGDAAREVLCGTAENVTACGPDASHRLTAGEQPPRQAGNVVTAARVAYADERDARLVVRVW